MNEFAYFSLGMCASAVFFAFLTLGLPTLLRFLTFRKAREIQCSADQRVFFIPASQAHTLDDAQAHPIVPIPGEKHPKYDSYLTTMKIRQNGFGDWTVTATYSFLNHDDADEVIL